MTWLWDAIAGCSAPGMNLFSALAIRAGSFFFLLIKGLLTVVNTVLGITILNTANSQQLAGSVFGTSVTPSAILLGMDALGLAVAVTAVIWSALNLNVGSLGGVRRDEVRALMGRTGAALGWMVATPLALFLLLNLNNDLVGVFVHAISQKGLATAFAPLSSTACNAGTGAAEFGVSFGVGIAGFVLFYLFSDVLVLALVVGVVVAFGQYFLRLFQVFFWGLLMPVAAGLSVGDPQRRAWTYVWGNVQGAIFTQAAMALGIFITEQIMVGGTFSFGAPPVAGSIHLLAYSGAAPATGSVLLFRFLVGIAGFFMVSRIPQYFQQMQGHAVGGGSEMGAIAGGYIMGRFGSQALQSTRAGQMFRQSNEARSLQHQAELGAPESGSFWRNPVANLSRTTYRQNATSAAAATGVVGLQTAQRRNASGATDSHIASETAQTQGVLDSKAANPVATDTTSFARPQEVTAPHEPNAGPGTSAVGGFPPSPPPPPSPEGGGDGVAGVGAATGLVSAFLPPASSPGRPTIGPGSELASGRNLSGADFATQMAPLALSYLRGQVRPNLAAKERGRADVFMEAAKTPVPTDPEKFAADTQRVQDRMNHAPLSNQATLQRAEAFRHFEQQLQIDPQKAISDLFQVKPGALDNPEMQQQMEGELRSALVNGPKGGSRLAAFRPEPVTDLGWATPV